MNDKVVYFNGELIIDESFRRVNDVIDARKEQCEFIYINDGRKNREEEISSINKNGIIVLFIGIILMFIDIIKNMFNKNELVNFTMMIGINIMMFGVVLGFTAVISQYIGRIFDESKGRLFI